MIRIIIYIFLFAWICAITSCEEQHLLEYKNDPGLQFYWGNIPGRNPQKDSLSCSFFIKREDLLRDTVWLRVQTMGMPANEDRSVKFIQLPENEKNTMAQPGVHYLPFDTPELSSLMVIKANQVQADLPVVLLKHASLKEREYRLTISIAPNEYFNNGITKYQTFLLKVADTADEPDSWKTWKYYVGDFGSAKMKFLITYLGIDFSSNYPSYMYAYFEGLAREKLAEYNSNPENEVLTEADGTIVSFD